MHDALQQRSIERLQKLADSLRELRDSLPSDPQQCAAAISQAPSDSVSDTNSKKAATASLVQRDAMNAHRDHRVMQTAFAAARKQIAALAPPPIPPSVIPKEEVLGMSPRASPTSALATLFTYMPNSAGEDVGPLLASAAVQHLCIQGEAEAAAALAQDAGVPPANQQHMQLYQDIHRVASGLRSVLHLQEAIAWAGARLHDLEFIGSKLAFRLHALQFVAVLLGRHTPPDIKAARMQLQAQGGGAELPATPPPASGAGSPCSTPAQASASQPAAGQETEHAEDQGGSDASAWDPVHRRYAFAYARRFLEPFLSAQKDDIGHLMSAALFMPHLEHGPYAEIADFEQLAAQVGVLYRRDRCHVEGVPFESPLTQVLAASVVAQPVLQKLQRRLTRRGGGGGLERQGELPVEVPLPQSMHFHSVFVCPVLRAAVDTRAEPPSLLPCGHLISSKAVARLLGGEEEGGCPLCHTLFHVSGVAKVEVK